MFISNNRASFHLWWKENLVKHQRVSKYYENDCCLVSRGCMVSTSSWVQILLRTIFYLARKNLCSKWIMNIIYIYHICHISYSNIYIYIYIYIINIIYYIYIYIIYIIYIYIYIYINIIYMYIYICYKYNMHNT